MACAYSLILLGNQISSKGACALAESLRHNRTFTQLNLKSMSEFIITCMWQDQANIFTSDNNIGSEGALALKEHRLWPSP